jgi:HEPN domain-containing protein
MGLDMVLTERRAEYAEALKAFPYAQDEEIVLGHSVERLCAAAARHRPEFADKARSWSLLDGYYIPTRYPNGLLGGIPADVYTQDAAIDAVALAEETVAWVKQLLDQAKMG